tara:strand:+ start:45 stop:1280 length:1236 start_codon:yes stop_codon:yes gene_type:complete
MGLKEFFFGEDPSKLNNRALEQQFHFANEMYAYNWATQQDNYAYYQENTVAQKMNKQAADDAREQAEYNGWLDRENMRLFEYSKEVEAYNASVKSYEEQIDFNNIATRIAINDADRVYQDQLIGFGYQNRDLLMKFDESKKQSALDIEGIGVKVDQAKRTRGLQIKQIGENDKWNKAQAAIDDAGLREGLAATKAEMGFKSQQARVENIQARGQQQNLGQSGRSAQKAIASLLASYGQGQTALADSITRAESKYLLDKRKVAETLSHKEALSQLSYQEVNDALLKQVEDANQASKGIGLKFEQLRTRTGFGREQIQQSITSSFEQDQAGRRKIAMDKYQQDIQAGAMLTTRPKIQPAESKPLQIPETVFVDPQKPTPPPKPRPGINTVPKQGLLSYINQVMNIAAPFIPGS